MGRIIAYQFPWARYPGVRIAVLFAAGIAVQAVVSADSGYLFVLFVLLLVIWLLTETANREKITIAFTSIAVVLYVISLFVFGALRLGYQSEKLEYEKETAGRILAFAWDHIRADAIVIHRFVSSSGRETFNLEVLEADFGSGIWNHAFKIRVYGSVDNTEWHDFRVGSRISAGIRIYDLEGPVNPGQFDYKKFLHRQGIFLHGDLDSVVLIESNVERINWSRLRDAVHSRIENLFDESTTPLAKALLTGDRQELDRDEQQYFARAGLSHIMAVSGMHVGFIVAPFWLVIPWLWQWRYGGWIGLLLLSVILISYAGLTGFSPSVSRASLMAWLLSTGKLLRRMKDSVNLMGVSAFILLLINPSQLFEIGFQLSFGAVFVILLLMPVCQQIIPQRIRYTKRGKLAMVVLVSFVVQLGLYPLLVWYFGEFSIIGPVANALVVPLLSAVVPGTFLLLPFADSIPPGLMSVLNAPNLYSLKWIGFVAEFLGGWHRSWITAEIDTAWFFIFWAAAIGFFATLKIPQLRYKYLIVLLGVLCLMLIKDLKKSIGISELKVVMLDVGQGDAVHIQTPGGKNIFIDTGRWNPMSNSGDRVIMPYLESKGIDRLDAVILSHPHADHIGGMPTLLNETDIGVIYYCGYDYDSVLYSDYRTLARQVGVNMQSVVKGDLLPIDKTIRVFVLGPDGRVHNSNPNDHSVVVKMVYNRVHMLFTGDAEQHQETRIRDVYGDFLKSDFLKAGHHGSRTSSHLNFLEKVQPAKAGVSLSFRNRFNHPHPDAVARLHAHTGNIFYTSLEGGLVFTTDGNTIEYKGGER